MPDIVIGVPLISLHLLGDPSQPCSRALDWKSLSTLQLTHPRLDARHVSTLLHQTTLRFSHLSLLLLPLVLLTTFKSSVISPFPVQTLPLGVTLIPPSKPVGPITTSVQSHLACGMQSMRSFQRLTGMVVFVDFLSMQHSPHSPTLSWMSSPVTSLSTDVTISLHLRLLAQVALSAIRLG